ncbi:MAG: DUF4383 domain-containing protein [Actinomycetota bacterium]
MSSIAQKFAKIFGAVYILVGAVGFVSALGGTASQTPNDLLGIFGVTLTHNVAHLAIGLLFIVGSFTPHSARVTCVGIGAAYLLLGTVGFLNVESLDGLLNLNFADNLLHLATGLLALIFGLVEVPAEPSRPKNVKAPKVKKAKARRERKVKVAPAPAPLADYLAQESAAISTYAPLEAPSDEPEEPAISAPEVPSPVASVTQQSPTDSSSPEVPADAAGGEPIVSDSLAAGPRAATEGANTAGIAPPPAPLAPAPTRIRWESAALRAERSSVGDSNSASYWIGGVAPTAQGTHDSATAQQPENGKSRKARRLEKRAQKAAGKAASAAVPAGKAASAVVVPAGKVAPAPAAPAVPAAQAQAVPAAEAAKPRRERISPAERTLRRRQAKADRKARRGTPPGQDGAETADEPVLVGSGPSSKRPGSA